MSIIGELLEKAVAADASDVHIKPGQEPFLRIHGILSNSGFDTVAREHIDEIVKDILPPHLVKRFEAEHEADFSSADADVPCGHVGIRADVAEKLGHKALTEAHDLIIALALWVKISAALSTAHRQRGE